MAKQVFENKDLVRMIYGFEPEHRERMKQVCGGILFPPVSRQDKASLIKLLNALGDNSYGYTFVQFFLKKRCHCCSRHCHRKPDIRLKEGKLVYDDGLRERVPEGMDMFDCKCDCRHVCRKIARSFIYF
jgi:hypothetical protein